MTVFKTVITNYRWHWLGIVMLTFLFSGFGIGVLIFINNQLLQATQYSDYLLYSFIGLLILFLITSIFAQVSLTTLGHRLVYLMRKELVKQILDTQTEHLNRLGKAKLLASLSGDIHSIAMAFVRLPELLQGSIFVLCAFLYIGYLSSALFLVLVVWIIFTLAVSHWAIKHVYKYLAMIRNTEDQLYANYQSAIEGHRELALNRDRAQYYYDNELSSNAEKQRISMVKADSYHVFANNWTNVMMLAIVGMTFYLALVQHWTDIQTATTISLTILFLRTPLISALGALPMILNGKVALNKLAQLELAPYQSDFIANNVLPNNWQKIRFENVSYHYPSSPQNNEISFSLNSVNFTLERGEIVFLVGENGSGKSTLLMLMTGLFTPTAGKIWIDEIMITPQNWHAYASQISAIFSDFYLFTQLLSQSGFAEQQEIVPWLDILQIKNKVVIANNHLSGTNLSQGQRKRLALLIALLEQRPLLILDEWAADQDPSFRRTFYEILLPLLKQKGKTIFAISHDDKYFHHADRVLMIKQGNLYKLEGGEQQTNRHVM